MKKLAALIFLVSSLAHAQFSVNGTLTSNLDTDWVILYSIEGSKQKFEQNTTIKKDTVTIAGKAQVIGTFSFQLPQDAKIGSYRINYRTSGAGFVDFIFNKEDVSLAFHPDYPEQTVLFSESKENILYSNYLNAVSKQQQKLDSLQVTQIRNPELNLNKKYQATLRGINNTQDKYLTLTEGMYVQPFIKASLRANSSNIKTDAQDYMSTMSATFFDHMNFSNKALINSSFLVDRITDYVFYMNYSEDSDKQQELYKQSIKTVFTKIEDIIFRKNVIEFLIGQFEDTKNLEMVDFLFTNYYDALPTSLQSPTFKNDKIKLLATEVGRIAPNFSWKEKGKKLQLATLSGAKNYVLVFWSTDCSHCLKEIPELHTFLQTNKTLKVIAFSMERNDFGWNNMKATLPNWHHVLGLNKWENKIARTYNIVSTPTYFLLNANKEIIAKPKELETLKALIDKL